MTLRTRTLMALGMTFLALIIMLPLITSMILTDRFRSIEDAEGRQSATRVEDALSNELAQLGRSVEDWAWWDATWRYVQGRQPGFADENLSLETLESLDLDLMFFVDRKGEVLWAMTRGPGGLEVAPDTLRDALKRQIAARTLASSEDVTTGVVSLPDGPWMVAIAPILRGDQTGPTMGVLVVGSRLDAGRVYAMNRVTHLSFRVLPYAEAVATLGMHQIPSLGHVRLGRPQGGRLPAWLTLPGLGGKPAALVELSLDRGIWRVGMQTQRYVVGALLLASLVFSLVAGITLERWVLRGLASLTEAVGRLGRIGATGGRLVVTGEDELSTLAGRINRMLEELERAEAARTHSDRRLALALEAANDGWFDWDVPGRSVYFSPRWCTMLGFAPDEIGNGPRDSLQLVHPEDLPLFEQRMRSHLRGSTPTFEAEARMRTSTGEWKWILARGRVVERSAKGRPLRMVGTQTDISERKRMESRLVMSDRLASVGTLAAGVAHEINNPLSYVITNLDVALRDVNRHADMAATREALEDAAEGAARVRAIVRDMKLFARDQVDTTGVDLRAVLDVATRMTAHEVRTRATLVDEVGELPLVTGSEARLGQVLVNLIVNAAQAMPPGRPAEENRIVVRARRNGASEVVFEVKDNGAGMDAAVQRRVFDPFFTTKPVGVGTGLGLYICHSLVHSFGGRIEVVSVLGEGTTFRITLPVWRPVSAPVVAPLVLVARRSRLLIVDDEPAIAAAVRRALGGEVEVVVASDGAKALEILAVDTDFDTVVCDLVMPGLDGPGFHAALTEAHPELLSRVVYASGGAPNARVQEFLDRGGIVCIEKPFTVEELRRLIASLRVAA